MAHYLETTRSGIVETLLIRPVVCPSGKPSIPHLLRYQGFGVKYYSLALDALDLRHPRLLQHKGQYLENATGN
jgi:hypothetical protein